MIIVTGTGELFCTELDAPSLLPLDTPIGWDLTYYNGKRLLKNLLDVEVPMIAAINGPATNMSEVPLLCDIVLASETTVFQDAIHFTRGVVPADGIQIVWEELLGPVRSKYFLLTQQQLSAQQALQLGVVNEVLPMERLLARAWELAEQMAHLPTFTLRYTRVVLNQRLRRRLEEDLGYGLALEGLSAINVFRQQ